MSQPHGPLTASQIEIMDIIWDRGKSGATVSEIWQELSARRPIARTTVLTMVNRLVQRGWLVRTETAKGFYYHTACGKEKTTGRMAARFIDEMFGGSTAELVRSLLGSQHITPGEIQRLRQLLDQIDEGEPS